ncbi:FAD binding domain protein [Colletotrichum plurivorum]|uniref:FAD binding domain protein n=1 Tax=Colletotrichum plurivorum TaxID=2175906 RepID=A0A8H6KKT9_9PEZI|nr:FAD binding domain protein [Colletotrichum plurivorum]
MTASQEPPRTTPTVPIENSSPSLPIYRTNTIVDGVLRYPPTGIKAVIVGGGVAGLFAALECWRKGIEVVVLEKAPEPSQYGDVMGIGPSGLSTLSSYPSMLQAYDSISHPAHFAFYRDSGACVVPHVEYEYNQQGVAQHAAFPLYIKSIVRRSQIANIFATQCSRLGIPIHYGVPITSYSEDEHLGLAVTIADDGRKFSGDVILAADGIGTKSHAVVLGHPTRANSTGFVMHRAVIPSPLLSHHDIVRKVASGETPAEVRFYIGDARGQHHAVTILPEVVCYITCIKDDGTGAESWSNRGTGAETLSQLEDADKLHPLITDGFKAVAEEKVVLKWLMAMRDPQPKWVSSGGRVAQVGDSAHSFLPSSGNGANTAMESAITVAECLRLGGKQGVGVAARVYELLRYQRASVIQKTGFQNRQQIVVQPETGDIFAQGKWLWAHKPEVYARENFARARAHIEHGAPFENTNLPPGHKFQDWTIAEEMAKEKAGVYVQDLKTNGDWGSV